MRLIRLPKGCASRRGVVESRPFPVHVKTARPVRVRAVFT